MPIYEFLCSSCGSRFEDLVGAGTKVRQCPGCGAEAERVLSPPGRPARLAMTPRTARRLEDARGVGRGGARRRFGERLRRARQGSGGGGER